MPSGDPAHGPRGSEGSAPATVTAPGFPEDGLSTVLLEATVSPFHCLYQDALFFHSQSHLRLPHSESEASRLARAGLLLYLASAEALVHQAVVELGRPELAAVLADPRRPLPLVDVWRLFPAVVPGRNRGLGDFSRPPWPQFAELLELRDAWAYPGAADRRRAYYRPGPDGGFEPLQPHEVPPGFDLSADRIVLPQTGLPRDPYALRPRHVDTARGILDAAIEAVDRLLDGALTHEARHRKEPVRRLTVGGSAR